jgi:hypothetical protein
MARRTLLVRLTVLIALVALVALVDAARLEAQLGGGTDLIPPAAWPFPEIGAPDLRLEGAWERVQEPSRPPLSAEFMAYQTAAGMIGGMSGSLLMILPFARGEVRRRDDSSRAPTVAALLGYFAGSATGVQLYSRYHGVRGSWGWTFGGAAIGAIGGPAFLITIPIGATIGFNQTRHAPADAPPIP